MSSKTIYSHIPYFYIIQHTPSGKFYAGCKYAQGCNPNTFMTQGGYTTSSNIVNDLIKSDGLNSFKTILIITEQDCGMSVYDYETIFLQTHDIAKDINYLNMHNNTLFPYGSENYINMILKKFEVDNVSKLDWIKEKKSATCLEHFGVDNPSKSEIVKDIKSQTCIENFGEDHHMKSDLGKQLYRAGMLEKHGVDHNMKLPEVRDKRAATLFENFGVDHTFQSPIIRAKGVATCLEKFGVENYSQYQKARADASIRLKDSTVWNDGVKAFRVYENDEIDPSWVRGHLPKDKNPATSKLQSEILAGCTYYNNGIITERVYQGETPKDGWVRGFAPRQKKYASVN